MKGYKLYFFRCPNCGEYRTTAETFQKFCPPANWRTIQETKEATGGLIRFQNGCPKCVMVGESQTTIILLKPRAARDKRERIN